MVWGAFYCSTYQVDGIINLGGLEGSGSMCVYISFHVDSAAFAMMLLFVLSFLFPYSYRLKCRH